MEAGATIASDFNTEIKNTLAMLADNPLLGSIAPPNIRRFLLRRFPFTLFYRNEPDTLRVIAVAHQSRMPEYWRPRS